MNDIQKAQPREIAQGVDRAALGIALSYYHNIEVDRGEPMLPELPTPAERKLMTVATADARALLRSIDDAGVAVKERAMQNLAAMLGGFTNMKGDPQQIATLFLHEMRKFPLFAIIEACNEIKRGSDRTRRLELKPAFAPTVPQLVQLVTAFTDPVAQDKLKIDKVLAVTKKRPEPASPKVQAEVRKNFDELVETLGLEATAEERRKKERTDAALDYANERMLVSEYEHFGLTPHRNKAGSVVSLSLLRSLGATIHDGVDGPVLLIPEPRTKGD